MKTRIESERLELQKTTLEQMLKEAGITDKELANLAAIGWDTARRHFSGVMPASPNMMGAYRLALDRLMERRSLTGLRLSPAEIDAALSRMQREIEALRARLGLGERAAALNDSAAPKKSDAIKRRRDRARKLSEEVLGQVVSGTKAPAEAAPSAAASPLPHTPGPRQKVG
jgi:hypothetical protein